MKLSLPSEDTLLSVSALAAGGLGAQVRALGLCRLREHIDAPLLVLCAA